MSQICDIIKRLNKSTSITGYCLYRLNTGNIKEVMTFPPSEESEISGLCVQDILKHEQAEAIQSSLAPCSCLWKRYAWKKSSCKKNPKQII
jgi:hypothetical protein